MAYTRTPRGLPYGVDLHAELGYLPSLRASQPYNVSGNNTAISKARKTVEFPQYARKSSIGVLRIRNALRRFGSVMFIPVMLDIPSDCLAMF